MEQLSLNIILTYTISFIGFIGSLCSIFSFAFDYRKKEYKKNNNNRKNRILFCMLILTTALLSVFTIKNVLLREDKCLLTILVISLCFCLYALISYAKQAQKSLKTKYVFFPKMLWQIIFNEIPSYLNYSKQTKYKFLVLEMDNSEEVKTTSERIRKRYQNSDDIDVEIKKADYKKNKNEYVYSPDLSDDLCGLLFIVGEECSNRHNQILTLIDCYAQNLTLPIAYIILGKYEVPFTNYYRIKNEDISNCANHLIMRCYGRSEKWVQLCNSMHKTLIYIFVLFIIILLTLLVTLRFFIQEEEKNSNLTEKCEKLNKEKKEISLKYGTDRSVFFLKNSFIVRIDSTTIDKCKKDELLNECISNYTDFFFSDIKPERVNIWLNSGEELVNIFNSTGKSKDVKNKGYKSIIGGVAKQKAIFLLWPGPKNKDKIWNNKDIELAWDEDGNPYISELMKGKDNKFNSILLKKNEEEKFDTIMWANRTKGSKSDDYAIFCYSPRDGQIVVEIDFGQETINENKYSTYIRNLSFRNEVRRYTCAVYSIIDYVCKKH